MVSIRIWLGGVNTVGYGTGVELQRESLEESRGVTRVGVICHLFVVSITNFIP